MKANTYTVSSATGATLSRGSKADANEAICKALGYVSAEADVILTQASNIARVIGGDARLQVAGIFVIAEKA